MGINKFENIDRAARSRVGEYDFDYRTEQAMYMATNNGLGVVDFSFGMLSGCDGEECLWLVVIVLVILAAVILVAASAYITHFWFLSGALLLGSMWIIFIRELRVRPQN